MLHLKLPIQLLLDPDDPMPPPPSPGTTGSEIPQPPGGEGSVPRPEEFGGHPDAPDIVRMSNLTGRFW